MYCFAAAHSRITRDYFNAYGRQNIRIGRTPVNKNSSVDNLIAPVIDQYNIYFALLALNSRYNIIVVLWTSAITIIRVCDGISESRVNICETCRFCTTCIATSDRLVVGDKLYYLLWIVADLLRCEGTPYVEVDIRRDVSTGYNKPERAVSLCFNSEPVK